MPEAKEKPQIDNLTSSKTAQRDISGKNNPEEPQQDSAPKMPKKNSPSKKTGIRKAIKAYADAFKEQLSIRKEFSKLGYVREKSETEKSYHEAKISFGEFRPQDRNAMLENNNSGKGVDVNLPNGKKEHFDNQAQLYDKIVKINKEKGSFYDAKKLDENPKDKARFEDSNKVLQESKNILLAFYENSNRGNQSLQRIELKEKNLQNENKPPNISKSEKSPSVNSTKDKSNRPDVIEDTEALENKKKDIASKKDRDNVNIGGREQNERKTPITTRVIPGDDITRGYVVTERKNDYSYAERKNEKKEILRDYGPKLKANESDKKTVELAVKLTKEKDWEVIKISGTKDFKRRVWMQASKEGIKVMGYTPSKKEQAELDKYLNNENLIAPVKREKEKQTEINKKESNKENIPSKTNGKTIARKRTRKTEIER